MIIGRVLCRPTASFWGGNIVNGDITLDDNAVLKSGNNVTGDLFVGEGTIIGPGSTFSGLNRFGTGNIIASGSKFLRITTGATVEIESGCTVTNSTLEDGAKMQKNSSATGATIKKGALVGPNATIGKGSTLYPGKQIGEGSCVGSKVEVNVNIPVKSYMNSDRKIMRIPAGKGVTLVNDVCTIRE